MANKKAVKVAETRLVKIIPAQSLELRKAQIDSIVKRTESNELHTVFTKAKGFFVLLEDSVKAEMTKRAKELKQRDESLITDVGKITYVERNNYKFDETKIVEFMSKKGIREEELYDISYTLNTNNAKILAQLLEKGIVAKVRKINVSKYETKAVEESKLLDFVENNVTEFVKGL